MRRALTVSLAAIAIIAAGCGGSSSTSSTGSGQGGKDADAVAQTWSDYIEAVKSGDGKAACQQLTPTFQRQAANLVTPKEQQKLKGVSCPEAIEKGTLRAALKSYQASLERIQINGTQATGFQPGEGALGAERVLFRKLGGDWMIFATVYQQGGPKFGS
jgi:2,4-dienoyl-CoA reductase-like NADH-dependent reductase (Old Yellow Enzyme family)